MAIEAKLDARSEFRSLAQGGWKLVVNIAVTLVIKLKKSKALPFLRVRGFFGKRTVFTLDGALD